MWTLASRRSRELGTAERVTVGLRRFNETLEARVQERTASLREGDERLARVNERLGSVNASLPVIGAPGPIGEHIDPIAAQLHKNVPAEVAPAVAGRTEAAVAPVVGLDADAVLPIAERERWRGTAEGSDRSGTPPVDAERMSWPYRLRAPLRDALGRTRGFQILGRETGGPRPFGPLQVGLLHRIMVRA